MESIIKRVLEISGKSQKELAEDIFVTPQAVSKWVRGESRPSLENVQRIYEMTGINVMAMANTSHCSRKFMILNNLTEIDDYTKAKQEAEMILQKASISENYSHAVYKLCTWLLPAVICLTHHQMINRVDDGIEYNDIFTNLIEYLDDEGIKKVPGLFENHLEYEFYLMGGDLFESSDECTIPDHEYCDAAMDDWYRFKKAVIKGKSSPVYSELLVAITEIVEMLTQ